jgi:hypothetical protein
LPLLKQYVLRAVYSHLLPLLPLCLFVSHLCEQQLTLLCEAGHLRRQLLKATPQLHGLQQ